MHIFRKIGQYIQNTQVTVKPYILTRLICYKMFIPFINSPVLLIAEFLIRNVRMKSTADFKTNQQ